MAKNNFPVVYYKTAMSQNVDSLNRVAVSETTVYNGSLVTLGTMGTGAAQGMGYVFPATLTSVINGNVNDVWMVRGPEVSKEVCGNLYDDPREFSIPAGTPFDIIRLMPGDIIHVSETTFGGNTKPSSTNKYGYADDNGEWQAASTATAVTGFVAQYQGTEAIVIGQDYLPAHILEVVKNPEATIS